jgi:biopolymer transport protein ExbD
MRHHVRADRKGNERQLRTQRRPSARSAPPRQLIINVRGRGAAVVANLHPEELADVLTAAIAKDAAIGISGDERTIMRHFASVAGICRHAGIGETRISYVDDSPAASAAK